MTWIQSAVKLKIINTGTDVRNILKNLNPPFFLKTINNHKNRSKKCENGVKKKLSHIHTYTHTGAHLTQNRAQNAISTKLADAGISAGTGNGGEGGGGGGGGVEFWAARKRRRASSSTKPTFLQFFKSHCLTPSNCARISGDSKNLAFGPPSFFGANDENIFQEFARFSDFRTVPFWR